MTVVEPLTAGAIWPEGTYTCELTVEVWSVKECGLDGTPVLRWTWPVGATHGVTGEVLFLSWLGPGGVKW